MSGTVELNAITKKNFTLLEIFLSDTISREVLRKIEVPTVHGSGVVISGRAPIWLYAFLVHELHPAAWIACYDSHIGKGIVVAPHTQGISVGDLIEV